MKKSILFIITLLLSISVSAQTAIEINSWIYKGTAEYKKGNYQEAIKYFEKVHEAYEKNGQKKEQHGTTVFLLAQCHSSIGDYSKAVEYGTMATEMLKDLVGENNEDFALLLFNLASWHAALEDYSKAVEYGTKVVEIVKAVRGENHQNYAVALTSLAAWYGSLGDYAKAVEYGTKSLEILKPKIGENSEELAAILSGLGSACFMLEDYAKAVEYETHVLKIRKNTVGENHPGYATSLSLLAKYHAHLGDYPKAIEYGTKAIGIYKANPGEQEDNYITFLEKLSGYHSQLGDYSKAMEYVTKVLEIRKATVGENHPDYAKALSNLGLCIFHLGDFTKAMEYETKAMEIRKATLGENHQDYSTSLSNLSLYLSQIGDYAKAIEYATKSVEIDKALFGENHPDYAKSLNNLAISYYGIGNFNKAVEYETKVMEIAKASLKEKKPLNALYAHSLSNLAFFNIHLGDIAKAVEYESKATEIRKAELGENHTDYATSLNNLASYYILLGNNSKAEEYLMKAMDIQKTCLGEKHTDYALTLNNLALCCFFNGKFSKALEYFKENISIVHSSILQTFTNLTASQRASYWAKNINNLTFTDVYPNLVAFSSKQENVADLYDKSALFAKGLLLTTETEMNKLILESGDQEALAMFEELQAQRLLLQKLYDTPTTERKANADSLAQAADQLESKLVERSKAYGDFTRKLRTTWKDVQSALGKDEIAVEFLSFGILGTDSTMVAALTLKKGYKAPKLFLLFQQDQLEALKDKQHFIRQEVTDLVWKPLQEELNGIHRIYFSPSGMLHSIGIEYLPGMEEYDIRRLSTTREVIDMKERPGKKKVEKMMAILYGGIDYEAAGNIAQAINENKPGDTSRGISASLHQAFVDRIGLRGSSFNPLPGTLTEVKNIKASFEEKRRQVNVLTGKEATESSFKALSAHVPGVLHIATHGFYYTEREKKMMDARRLLTQDDDRLGAAEKEDKALTRSGLLLAGANNTLRDKGTTSDLEDGILTAQEISKLDLRGLDLVVLSACETGKGDVTQGEGVFGLQRGFKKAGAGTIVMSLWKVDDNATQMMMTQFYKNLCNGMDKHEALQMAQKQLREYKDEKGENIYDQPLFWAGFIILD